MNRNTLVAAVPFAALFDVLLAVRFFGNYVDPTMTVLMIGSLVVSLVLVFRGVGYFSFPTFSNWFHREPEIREVHHYHDTKPDCEDCEDCNDCDCDDDCVSQDEADDRADSAKSEGYDNGYEEGYKAREEEELDEAEAIAKAVVEQMNKPKETPVQETAPVQETPPTQ